jgi:pimeloyl-ACP methyl ester carboxylesterase
MERGYARTPAGLVHYWEAGTGDPIVLLGSSGRSARMFHALIRALAPSHRAIGIDLLGSGGSDPLPVGATIPGLAENVVEVLDALGLGTVDLFGLHTGNKIGSALAARFPYRLRSFVLCGQTHSIVPDRQERNAGIGDRAKTYQGELDDDRAQLVAWAMLSQRMSDLWWNQEGFSTGNAADAVAAAHAVALDELQSFASVSRLYAANFAYDMARDWPRITVPTLVLEIVTPREQALYGRQGEDITDLIPGARLVTLTATGYKHTFEDRALELTEVIRDFCYR